MYIDFSQSLYRTRGRSRRIAKFLQESILIAFDFIWKVLLSGINFATLLDPSLGMAVAVTLVIELQFFSKQEKVSGSR